MTKKNARLIIAKLEMTEKKGALMNNTLKDRDRVLYDIIQGEYKRQFNRLEMIASENLTSRAVMEAQGSVLTNKYAEGYPSARYYGGCEEVDKVENLAIERGKKLFGSPHINVQPHSGSQANMGVYLAVLNPGDTIMGMSLSSGGHLTHGSKVNFSGKIFNAVGYDVNKETLTLDYDAILKTAKECRPKMLVTGGSAYPRVIDFARFREIANEVGAYLLVDMAHFGGLVAAGLHPSPVKYADFVTGTTHKTLRGPRGGYIMAMNEEYAKKIDKTIFPGIQGGPLMHVVAAKAVCFGEALDDSFKAYQKSVLENMKTLTQILLSKGYDIISGGTDTHLALINTVASRSITGVTAETSLDEAFITTNKNGIPFDPNPPKVTSGIRIGTPAITSRGMRIEEMKEIADMIDSVLSAPEDEKVKKSVATKVVSLCERFPIYTYLPR